MLIPKERIEDFCATLREAGQRIVFTNGCFDILHAGHVRYLEEARALGDCLVLGLNTDASVRRLKGESRPVNTELDRAAVTGALVAEPTAETLIEKVRPAVYAKGGDYTRETLPEAKIVEKYGGEVHFIDLVPGRSTTKIIEKINRK